MMNLFSSFDLMNFSLVYIFYFFFFSFATLYSYKINLSKIVINAAESFLMNFFFSLKKSGFNKGMILFLLTFTSGIFLLNYNSVFSYNFPLTSQFSFILGCSLTIWCSFMLFSIFSSSEKLLSHFIPEGSPYGLMFFLFMVEIVSSIIRPITLAVRLVANILAGHLLMILLSNLVFLKSGFFFFYIFLNTVEIFVSLIQSYIFATMVALYFIEI